MDGEFLIICIPDKTSVSIMIAFQTLQRQYGEYWNDIFKSITTDNGFEIADLANLEEVSRTLGYSYTSCDKSNVERHNGLIPRFTLKDEYIIKYFLDRRYLF